MLNEHEVHAVQDEVDRVGSARVQFEYVGRDGQTAVLDVVVEDVDFEEGVLEGYFVGTGVDGAWGVDDASSITIFR